MVYVYVLRSLVENRLYVGMSEKPDQRLFEHNSGKTKSTKGYRPWERIHLEEFPDRVSARNREVYLKSGFGKNGLKKNIVQLDRASAFPAYLR